jgi:isoleucyl-tRNA synthetase
VKKELSGLPEAEIKRFLSSGELGIVVNGTDYRFGREEIEIRLEGKEGFAVASDGEFTVALTTEIDENLRNEGFARELVNKIQNMRKEANLRVTDRISVYLKSSEPVIRASELHSDYIKKETLADSIASDSLPEGFARDWDVNGESATIVIRA